MSDKIKDTSENKKPQVTYKTISIDNELIEVLDKLKEKIIKHGWGALNPSYADVSRVLARKIKAVGII